MEIIISYAFAHIIEAIILWMSMAVIKADGYGHGAVEVAHYLNDIADYFGVATIDEGVELRKAGLKQPILLLGYNSPSLYYKNLEYGVDQTIYCYDTAKAMSEAAVDRKSVV